MSHFRSRSSSGASGGSGDSRNSRASGEYEEIAGNDQASPGRAYAQRAWDQGALSFVDMRTPGRSSSHQSEYSSDEPGEDDYGRDDFEGDEDEPLFSQQLEGMDEYARPSTPEDAPQSVPSAPPIVVSEHGVPSARSGVSGHSAEALAPGRNQGEGQAGFEPHYLVAEYNPHYPDFDNFPRGQIYFGDSPFLHPSLDPSPSGSTPLPLRPAEGSSSGRSAERVSPRSRPNVSPHPLSSTQGSMVARGSPPPPGSESGESYGSDDGSQESEGGVSVESSPSVQELPSATEDFQRGAHGGAQYAGQYLDPHQQRTGHLKRVREGSSSSSGSHLRPPRKHPGYQGPSGPHGVPQDQQRPMQNIGSANTDLLGISGLEARGQPSAQGASRPYGEPNPHGRAGASEADAEQIRQAYAYQDLPESRPINPFAGMPQGAPSAYASGLGRGYGLLPPQGGSSAQGAGQSQPYPAHPGGPHAPPSHTGGAVRGAGQLQYQPPVQGAGPGAAPSRTGGGRRGKAPQAHSQGESSAQGAGQSRPYPPQPGAPYAPQHQAMQGAGPGAASSWTGGTWSGNPPQGQSQGGSSGQGAGQLPPEQRGEPGDRFINRFGPSVGVPQPEPEPDMNPMRGMDAGDIWRFISGQGGPEDNEGINWEGRLYRVDETKFYMWPSHQVAQLRVIVASYLSWEEVVDLGQPLPGQRSPQACAKKAWDLADPGHWTIEQDSEVSRLSSPRLEDRQAALNRLQGEFGRSKDEIVGRCMYFARSSQRQNLGNQPSSGLNRLLHRK